MRTVVAHILLVLGLALWGVACDEPSPTEATESPLRTVIQGQVLDSWQTAVPGVELSADAFPDCRATPANTDPLPAGTSRKDGRFESTIQMPSGRAETWCLDLYATPTAQDYLEADTVLGLEVEFEPEGSEAPAPTTEIDVTLESNAVTSTEELRARLDVTPSVIQRDDSLLSVVRITNPMEEWVEMVSSCIQLLEIVTFRGDQRVDLEGTISGCFTAEAPYRIGPGEMLTKTYVVRAVREDGEPVDPGTYRLRVDFNVGLPDLEDSFEIE